MRLVIARCEVDYAGPPRAPTCPSPTRLIMVKADGCVAIHADGGAYKPLNWMNAPNRLGRGRRPLGRDQPQGRDPAPSRLHAVVSATRRGTWASDPGLQKDGVEAHLQVLLAASGAQAIGGRPGA